MIYLDSSAIIKLVVAEPESNALRAYLAEHEGHVSSGLARVEVSRALRRTNDTPAVLRYADQVLERIVLVAVDGPVIAGAASLDPPLLRSLDAIHLATALSLEELDALVTYDRRLSAAAQEAGLVVTSPG